MIIYIHKAPIRHNARDVSTAVPSLERWHCGKQVDATLRRYSLHACAEGGVLPRRWGWVEEAPLESPLILRHTKHAKVVTYPIIRCVHERMRCFFRASISL
eukprot:GHVT01001729.1.p1 GENE.GHVT01001729.1~~GHVT01001729.1.p1  ORF type:complete len:101 (-),score=4.49 GHVT01001729.1:723-1025(-)